MIHNWQTMVTIMAIVKVHTVFSVYVAMLKVCKNTHFQKRGKRGYQDSGTMNISANQSDFIAYRS